MNNSQSFSARVRNKVRHLRDPQPARDDRVPRLRQRVNDLSEQVTRLNERVTELDEELLDARSQGRRIGEISDMVVELLVSEATRRDPEFRRIVDRYAGE